MNEVFGNKLGPESTSWRCSMGNREYTACCNFPEKDIRLTGLELN